MNPGAERAVVLLSGGLDSATTLAIARNENYECHSLAFDYGQRHAAELAAAQQVSAAAGCVSHRVIRIGLDQIGGSALTDHRIDVPEDSPGGIPVTYVPARNTIFLALALGLAETLRAQRIYIGVNAVDYSGYPDCRPEFIEAFAQMAQLATRDAVQGGVTPEICTPLIELSKAQIIARGIELRLDYSLTVSCYQADDAGRACGRCDSCRLRAEGFASAGLADPTRYVGGGQVGGLQGPP